MTEENLGRVDAVEIKIGQSAKPGLGGHLPGKKVTAEIAGIRGFKEGEDIVSPARFRDILNREDLRKKLDWLRSSTGGKPVGLKLAAGHIEAAAAGLANDLRVTTEDLRDFARLTGNEDVHGLSLADLCTANSEISNHTGIEHV